MVYDPADKRIYASVPGRAGSRGNSITSIDTTTVTVGTSVLVGSEPNRLAISDDSRYLYTTFRSDEAVRRFDLAAHQPEQSYWLGNSILSGATTPTTNGPFTASDIKTLPGSHDSVALLADGVDIYDKAVRRPVTTSYATGLNRLTSIVFGNSGATLYGLGESGDFVKMAVSAGGVTVVNSTPYYQMLYTNYLTMKFDHGLVFTSRGQVVDPDTPKILGTFAGLPEAAIRTVVEPDSTSNRVFFLTGALASNGVTPYTLTLKAYDRSTFALVGSVDIPGVVGDPFNLIRWGSNGLAFRTDSDQVFLLRTSLVPSSDSVTMAQPGPTPTPTPTATPAVSIRELSLPNFDLIYDPLRQLIYASVPAYAGGIGNSITTIEPVSGSVGMSTYIGADPGKLAISRNGQYLYAALNGEEAVRRLDLTNQTLGAKFPIGHMIVPPQNEVIGYPHYVYDMNVVPDHPESVVVSRVYAPAPGFHYTGVGCSLIMECNEDR